MVYTPDQLAHEELVKNQLSHAQSQQQQQTAIAETTQQIKKPSFLGYLLLFFLAAILDIIDLIEFTGVGIIISKIIQVFATIFFVSIAFLVNKKIKRMRMASDFLDMRAKRILLRVQQLRTRYAAAIKLSRKVKFLRKPVRKFALATRKISKAITRNPIGKSLLANVLEFIPLVGVLPFQMISVYLMYRDHKKTYAESLATVPEYQEAKAAEEEEFNNEQVELYERIMAESLPGEDNSEPA